MCGFVISTQPDRLKPTAIGSAMAAIGHRGTLPPTVAIRDGYEFGHVRLPIQSYDDTGKQPVTAKAEGGKLETGVFVGEVFNLSRNRPDTNQVIEILTNLGPHAANNFDGFFAVAYTYQSKLIVQTDHLGIKPIYYDTHTGLISNELKPFIKARRVRCDELYFSNVIKFGYDPTGRTPIDGVYRLKPGHYWQFDVPGERPTEHKYFHLSPTVMTVEEIHRRLTISLTRRLLRSNKPVGILCSGGLDSSLVAQLAMLHGGNNEIRIYHVDNDESEYLDYMNWTPNVTLKKLELLSPEEMNWENVLWANDTPVDLGSVFPQYALAEALHRENLNVVLTGDGADELFGGYRRAKLYDSQRSDIFCELPSYHLPRLDSIMMNFTIELRSPFLAPDIVCGAMGIPYAQRTEKQVLKEIARRVGVPDEIINREKKPLKNKHVVEFNEMYRVRLCNYYREMVERRNTYG